MDCGNHAPDPYHIFVIVLTRMLPAAHVDWAWVIIRCIREEEVHVVIELLKIAPIQYCLLRWLLVLVSGGVQW